MPPAAPARENVAHGEEEAMPMLPVVYIPLVVAVPLTVRPPDTVDEPVDMKPPVSVARPEDMNDVSLARPVTSRLEDVALFEARFCV